MTGEFLIHYLLIFLFALFSFAWIFLLRGIPLNLQFKPRYVKAMSVGPAIIFPATIALIFFSSYKSLNMKTLIKFEFSHIAYLTLFTCILCITQNSISREALNQKSPKLFINNQVQVPKCAISNPFCS